MITNKASLARNELVTGTILESYFNFTNIYI